MVFQSIEIWFVDSFEYVKDDACETVVVEVYFLVVGDLSDLTVVASS